MRERVNLAELAAEILNAADPAEKVALSRRAASAWAGGDLSVGAPAAPTRPARLPEPSLRPPRDMKRRRSFGSPNGRVALLHALAHIELNAIDLAWDIAARFADPRLPRAFFTDWVGVAAEEAEHYALLAARLRTLGARYGELPAHDGLWEAAAATGHELIARLAVVPLVLEARGLDVTPDMIGRLERAGDHDSAAILTRIYTDEIRHVAVGARWFAYCCDAARLDPEPTYHDRVRRYFSGLLKPPFNRVARDRAGFPARFYEPLAYPLAYPEHRACALAGAV
ncbi:MAG: ferritin-like domain-containing protein [Alphaproteobacteria bacterium]|nr:ferritin-like domain-containing protein [Alphaproteobacteria bacterium]